MHNIIVFEISIHAPPRGATLSMLSARASPRRISIHAPPRGATLVFCSSFAFCPFQFTPLREGRLPIRPVHPRVRGYFNSRPSARGDREFVHGAARVGISIHAPPRGATCAAASWRFWLMQFQFTPLREGRRATFPVLSRCIVISIHAPPRGATRPDNQLLFVRQFQFTPLREGRRAGNGNRLLPPEISIHAPPRGATLDALLAASKAIHFNSRPSARGDH